MSGELLVALAGQPNSGKSTIFNLLTGARQFVANYPGVTVEKKVGYFSESGKKVELVDLPGTYSITSYSQEERVACDFLLHERPALVLNVVDASNLRRSLYLTFQLLEMGLPLVVDLNMMDVATNQGRKVDSAALAKRLGVRVIESDGKRGRGREELRRAATGSDDFKESAGVFKVDYGDLEPGLARLEKELSAYTGLMQLCPARWLALKLLEGDLEATKLAQKHAESWPALEASIQRERELFDSESDVPVHQYIAFERHGAAAETAAAVTAKGKSASETFTARADKILCHRLAGPVVMCAVFYLLFELAVNQGQKLAALVIPYLGATQAFLQGFLPDAGFMNEPVVSSLGAWFMTSVSALLVYVPQFFILFSLIAVLEDVGYMPRMAFMLDRVFQRFGLHGNSTLPLILGGIYVGGCAVPGVMACRAVPDERARLATILTVPLMNCLAKTVFYLMLVTAFFPENKAGAMFFISSITLIMALPIARVLTMTVLKKRETAPFIMEMPSYHLPTVRGVLTRALERVWTYIKKVLTIVAAVSVVIWALLQFPGVPDQTAARLDLEAGQALAKYHRAVKDTALAKLTADEKGLMTLFAFREDYRSAKTGARGDRVASKAVDAEFKRRNPAFFTAIKVRKSKEYKAFNKLRKDRSRLWRQRRQARINNSILGKVGQALEPVSRWAGFDWRVNVAMLSSFAARESATATFKVLYGIGNDGQYIKPTEAGGDGRAAVTSLNAVALMLFMALFPPCLATTIMVRVATRSYGWMAFSFAYPAVLGMAAAVLVYSCGSALGLSGWQAMWTFYGLALAFALIMGIIPEKQKVNLNEGA